MWYMALTFLPSLLYALATSPLPSNPPSSAENKCTSTGCVRGRHPPRSSAASVATRAVVPEPSSSAPGARRNGSRFVLSWCAEMRTAGAEGGTEGEVQRTMRVRWDQVECAKGTMVRFARGLSVACSCVSGPG